MVAKRLSFTGQLRFARVCMAYHLRGGQKITAVRDKLSALPVGGRRGLIQAGKIGPFLTEIGPKTILFHPVNSALARFGTFWHFLALFVTPISARARKRHSRLFRRVKVVSENFTVSFPISLLLVVKSIDPAKLICPPDGALPSGRLICVSG